MAAQPYGRAREQESSNRAPVGGRAHSRRLPTLPCHSGRLDQERNRFSEGPAFGTSHSDERALETAKKPPLIRDRSASILRSASYEKAPNISQEKIEQGREKCRGERVVLGFTSAI